MPSADKFRALARSGHAYHLAYYQGVYTLEVTKHVRIWCPGTSPRTMVVEVCGQGVSATLDDAVDRAMLALSSEEGLLTGVIERVDLVA